MSFQFEVVPSQHAEVIHTHSRSFSMAARLLPAHARRNTELLYAWCRWCDDAVDRAPSPEAAARQLDQLREDVLRIYAGQRPRHQASAWLASVVECCEIPLQLPMDLLVGMEMDLSGPQVDSLDELLTYCYHAAGCVGSMMCHVLGVKHNAALEKACDLGIAMQLTNISRDVLEDWQRGRCYLPSCWLDFPIHDSEPPESSCVKPLVAKLLTLADRYYERAGLGIPLLPRNVQPAIELAATLYRGIGTEIRRRDCDVMSGRVHIPKLRIAALACRPTGRWLSALMLDGWGQFKAKFFRKTIPIWTVMIKGEPIMYQASKYLASLGLSLTLIMATALFALVACNPKDASYGSLPLVYAGLSAAAAAIFGYAAARLEPAARAAFVCVRNK